MVHNQKWIRQGSILSPTSLNITMRTICLEIKKHKKIVYTDDVIIWTNNGKTMLEKNKLVKQHGK